ncbi:MAG: BlaI/MecI/CopY family transcriptional regulator [Deltaproteobacteria bacterium]|nr:BlaI/MecI/CopY family transcriptional regulator [Deltaproteobacteria bacterium]
MISKDDNPIPGGDLERALLVLLWEHRDSPCTARDLHDKIAKDRNIVYTTVTKVLDRMVEKGLIERRRAGRAFVYNARVNQEQTQRSIVRDALRSVLGKNPRPAVAALVGAIEDVSPELLDELAAQLADRRKEPGNGT